MLSRILKRKCLLIAGSIVCYLCLISRADTATWTTFPPMPQSAVLAIDGSNVAGWTSLDFYYDGVTLSFLNMSYWINGMSGRNIATDHGIYNLDTQTLTKLSYSEAKNVDIEDIDGSNFAGQYTDYDGKTHGVVYNLAGQSWTTIDYPGAFGTTIDAIDKNNVVGHYWDAYYHNYNFLYDGTSFTPLSLQGYITGFSGRNISTAHSIYNLDTGIFTSLAFPGAGQNTTIIFDIDGNRIGGMYADATGKHGFIATIPEPGTVLLLGLGVVMLRKLKGKI
jgi:hypothetical protein